jgi:hypothetical protein
MGLEDVAAIVQEFADKAPPAPSYIALTASRTDAIMNLGIAASQL